MQHTMKCRPNIQLTTETNDRPKIPKISRPTREQLQNKNRITIKH